MTTPTTAPLQHDVDSGRARIDQIDAAIAELVHERTAVSRRIQATRLAAGGPRVVSAREVEVVGRWRNELGGPGRAIAMALLELGRGRAV
jgi:chorismate mutase